MLDTYRSRMNLLGSYDGEAKRRNSQKIMDASWMRDPGTKPVFVKWVDSGLPVVTDNDIPVYAKYAVKSYYNVTGDEIAYLLQFRLDDMQNNPDIKVGSYVQIKNELNEPEWWLIVHLDDRPQFRQFSIVKCMWVYKWVSEADGRRVIHQCLGAPRKQNSYNAGIWEANLTVTVENQEVAWMPTNDDTVTMLYDTRLIKSSSKRKTPLVFKVTKVEDTAWEGVTRFTFAQTMYDADVDNIELGIADYSNGAVAPISATSPPLEYQFTYTGNPAVRAGGNFKKFVLKRLINGDLVDITDAVTWAIDFEGHDDSITYETDGGVIRVKCDNDYSLIGEIFTITAQIDGTTTTLETEVDAL